MAETTGTAGQEGGKITIDGRDYSMTDLSEKARATLGSIRFCDEQIMQRRNELAVADTAKTAYANALRRELAKGAAHGAEAQDRPTE